MKFSLLQLMTVVLMMASIVSCKRNQQRDNWEYEEISQPINIYQKWELSNYLTNIHWGGKSMRKNIGIWGYENGYTYLKGVEYRDSLEFDFKVKKSEDLIFITIKGNLKRYGDFPQVWRSSGFGHYDEANHLKVDLIVTNNQDNRRMYFSEKAYIDDDKDFKQTFFIAPEELAHVTHGMLNFKMDIRTEFVSFHGYTSGKRAMRATVSVPFFNPQFYKTDVYFKSVVLNKEIADQVLGESNDLGDPRPETAVWVKGNGQTFQFGALANSYSYHSREKTTIYHIDPEEKITISVVDADFIGDDEICDTLIPIRDLYGEDYHSLKLSCVDELWMYARQKGWAN